MLPPEDRLVGAQLERYIKNQLYWVLHAPRQSGKTTFLQSWMRKINASDEAISCYVSVERCQEVPLAADAMPAICSAIREYAKHFLGEALVPPLPQTDPSSMLSAIMIAWSGLVASKPLVVLFDEVDVLQDQALVGFLRQIRGGFAMRGIGQFPVSVALVGMRDLRDYLIKSKDGEDLNPGSPFNIKQDSAQLSNFALDDIPTFRGY
ncbi:MAG: AAA family ATPase [Rectinemataceae bacterium]